MIRHITIATDIDIAVQDLGEGRPVVLLPGFGFDHTVWDGQVALLSQRHRTLCIDLRGTGDSSKPLSGYSLDRITADVLGVVDYLGIDSFDVLGWSFGGQVAFNLACQHPDRVRRVVLVGSNGVRACRSSAFPFGASRERLESALLTNEIVNRPVVRRSTILAGFANTPDAAVLDFLTGISLRMPSWAAIECYQTMLNSDLTNKIAALDMPIRFVTGSEDRVHPIGGARWLTSQLADAELFEIQECGHYPMFENPETLNRFLVAALADTPTASCE